MRIPCTPRIISSTSDREQAFNGGELVAEGTAEEINEM